MTLRNVRELETTRAKLKLLEDRYEASKREQGGNEYVRELSRRSVKRLINQMKEEVARFEAHGFTKRGSGAGDNEAAEIVSPGLPAAPQH